MSMYLKGILKGHGVPAGIGTGEKSGGRVAVRADLYRAFSIVCLSVCSAPCQAAVRDRSMSRVDAS